MDLVRCESAPEASKSVKLLKIVEYHSSSGQHCDSSRTHNQFCSRSFGNFLFWKIQCVIHSHCFTHSYCVENIFYIQQFPVLFSTNFNNLLIFKVPCSTTESFAVIGFGEAGRASRKTSGLELFDAFGIKKHQSSLTAARSAKTSLNFNNFQQFHRFRGFWS